MRAARELVAGALRDALPKWRVEDKPVALDRLDRMTAVVTVTDFGREQGAPLGAYDVTVEVLIVSPKSTNFPEAEEQLEDAVPDAIAALEDAFGTSWDSAEKVTFQDTYLAWKVPVHVLVTRKAD